ncbi:hypothetical protein INR49_018169, partial [Caranx melampygus]
MLLAAPVKAGRGLLWFLATGWYQLVSLMCLLNVFFLTRCLPKLWKLLLFLLPLLLLLALWLWGPSTAALLAYLPAINLTEWRPVSPITYCLTWCQLLLLFLPLSPHQRLHWSRRQPPQSHRHHRSYHQWLSPLWTWRLERVERQLALLG